MGLDISFMFQSIIKVITVGLDISFMFQSIIQVIIAITTTAIIIILKYFSKRKPLKQKQRSTRCTKLRYKLHNAETPEAKNGSNNHPKQFKSQEAKQAKPT